MHIAKQILYRVGAIIPGSHAVSVSGEHDSADVDIERIFLHPQETARLCRDLAERFENDEVKTVVALAGRDSILAHLIAYYLFILTKREVFNVSMSEIRTSTTSSEGKGGDRLFIEDKDESFVTGRKVLVVVGSISTNAPVKELVKMVRDTCGTVIGIGTLCSRVDLTTADIGAIPKPVALTTIIKESMSAEECRRFGPCSKGIPIHLKLNRAQLFLV